MHNRAMYIENKHFYDLNPLAFGAHSCDAGYTFGFDNMDAYLIHCVISGEGKVRFADRDYPVHAGELFVIRKGETAQYTADGKNPWHYVWIIFDGALTKRLDRLAQPVAKLHSGVHLELLKAFEQNYGVEEYLASMLFLLFRDIFSEHTSANYIEKVKNYIDVHYMEPVCIEEIALGMGLSRKYLSMLFKKETDITIQQYLFTVKMTHAKRMLKEGCNVSQAAFKLSYSDAFAFSKAYKNYYGYPPSKERSK